MSFLLERMGPPDAVVMLSLIVPTNWSVRSSCSFCILAKFSSCWPSMRSVRLAASCMVVDNLSPKSLMIDVIFGSSS